MSNSFKKNPYAAFDFDGKRQKKFFKRQAVKNLRKNTSDMLRKSFLIQSEIDSELEDGNLYPSRVEEVQTGSLVKMGKKVWLGHLSDLKPLLAKENKQYALHQKEPGCRFVISRAFRGQEALVPVDKRKKAFQKLMRK